MLVWDYFDPKGKLITNAKVKERCNKLVLPPAWQDVWISVDASAHLQATGVDARGRLQYRYHAAWTAARAEEKFNGMTRFAKMLPRIRRKVDADLKLEGMPRDKVVALIVKLIDGVKPHLDPEYSMMYQVVDKPNVKGIIWKPVELPCWLMLL